MFFSDVKTGTVYVMINTIDTFKNKYTLMPIWHHLFKTLYVGLALKIASNM